eukprot:gene40687-50342_t
MNIDKFKHQHEDILADIAALRRLVQGGIEANAERIAARIIASNLYQLEMNGIVSSYLAFATTWNAAAHLQAAPEKFRTEANTVLRKVYHRIKKEDHEFYPAAEALEAERLAA